MNPEPAGTVALDREPEALTRYLRQEVPALGRDIRYRRFTGGNSNLTFLVQGEGQDLVLKLEPPGTKARSAHDMGREFRMLRSLEARYPFSPRAVLLCEDPEVFGGTFVLMERRDGLIVRDASAGVEHLPAQFTGLIDALAALHAIDPAEVGLHDAGRPEGYRRRQTEGWIQRFRGACDAPGPLAEEVMGWLAANIPADPELASVIHNDFKMDNLVWDADEPGRLKGVLDWEMSTVGDPLMDLACTLSFWVDRDDPAELRALRSMPSANPGVPSRREALERYLERRGAALADFTFYRCFGLFRRAAIEQQKFRRYSLGQTTDARFKDLDKAVGVLLRECGKLL